MKSGHWNRKKKTDETSEQEPKHKEINNSNAQNPSAEEGDEEQGEDILPLTLEEKENKASMSFPNLWFKIFHYLRGMLCHYIFKDIFSPFSFFILEFRLLIY